MIINNYFIHFYLQIKVNLVIAAQKFYTTKIKINRLSESYDILPITVSERLLEEVDLSTLSQYPNLKYITVGKDVKRVTTTPEFEEKSVDDKTVQRTQKNVNGKETLMHQEIF